MYVLFLRAHLLQSAVCGDWPQGGLLCGLLSEGGPQLTVPGALPREAGHAVIWRRFPPRADDGCRVCGVRRLLCPLSVPSLAGSSWFLVGNALKRNFRIVLWFSEEAWSHSAQRALVCDKGQSACPSVCLSLRTSKVGLPQKWGCCLPRWGLVAVKCRKKYVCPGEAAAGPCQDGWPCGPWSCGGHRSPCRLRAERPRPLSPGSLLDRTGKILVPGLSEAVAPVTAEELQLYDDIDFDLEEYAKDVGAETLLHSCKVPCVGTPVGGSRRGWRRHGVSCAWPSAGAGRSRAGAGGFSGMSRVGFDDMGLEDAGREVRWRRRRPVRVGRTLCSALGWRRLPA